MKYSHSYKFINIILIFLFIFFYSSEILANLEDDFKEITSKLRCMTCQNQTIYDSDAEFSLSIKNVVREKLNNNESKNEIIDFLIDRYGEYITFEPKISKQNLFLWLFPFTILAVSFVFLIIRIRKNK